MIYDVERLKERIDILESLMHSIGEAIEIHHAIFATIEMQELSKTIKEYKILLFLAENFSDS